tara:strand:- start:780 stop:1001 length:222 start_codon:yes stop_codon:yes gene_type:complete
MSKKKKKKKLSKADFSMTQKDVDEFNRETGCNLTLAEHKRAYCEAIDLLEGGAPPVVNPEVDVYGEMIDKSRN